MDFGQLYNYLTKNGIVIPQTTAVKANVENAFRTIFGNSVDVTEDTAIGRFIEAISLLFVDFLGITAVNANNFNPAVAVGSYLDNLGSLFGVSRPTGASDTVFRNLLMQSVSRGTGYADSIRAAISAVPDVISICVLENGHSYPVVLPNSSNGIAVAPHSVFVCVAGGTDEAVAKAIYGAKSAGCGYTETAEYGTVTTETITDLSTGSENSVSFYRPAQKVVSVAATIRSSAYTGSQAAVDVAANAIRTYFADHSINSTVTAAEIGSAVSATGSGIYCQDVDIVVGTEHLQRVSVLPYQYIDYTNMTIGVVEA